jgi:uncharacterized protein (UPF0332 family)
MSFDWSEYLILAQELAAQGSSSSNKEARLRSAISRAYYAAFCMARNHLISREKRAIPRNVNVHRFVIDRFERSPDISYRIVGNFLRNLRADRNAADYKDQVGNLPALTRAALKPAEETIFMLGSW